MPHAHVNGVELYYETHGDGPPLVLIPGFGTGLWIWFKQVGPFSARCRTVVFDPRGVARSEQRDEPVTIRLIADDVAALLDALGIARAHVLGASFGGFVAQEFALAYPEKTESLILCCTSFGGPRHVPPSFETLQALASTKGLNTEARVRENLLVAFSPSFVAAHPDEIEQVISLRAANFVPEHAYLHQLQAAMAFDTEARVAQTAAPTLVLTGDADTIVPPQNAHNLAALIPGARLRVLPGGSHTFFIEQADEFNRAVLEFIEEVQGSKFNVQG
ncbi:MAG TPA: alpha/beta fold hydrolase [Pyrinomonadaceae bacterium]|jgi:pimeloyl-ACP methyl ester carboxylesterase